MINRGFNPLMVISQQTGKSIGDLKEEMKNGAITSQMVAQAFADATAEGGLFHGIVEGLEDKIVGSQQKLKNAIIMMKNDIGANLEGFISTGFNGARVLVENYQHLLAILGGVALQYGKNKAVSMLYTAQNEVHYGKEIKAIEQLLRGNEAVQESKLRQLVVEGKLSQDTANKLLLLRAELQERIELMQIEVEKGNIQVANTEREIRNNIAIAKLSKSKIADIQQEIIAIEQRATAEAKIVAEQIAVRQQLNVARKKDLTDELARLQTLRSAEANLNKQRTLDNQIVKAQTQLRKIDAEQEILDIKRVEAEKKIQATAEAQRSKQNALLKKEEMNLNRQLSVIEQQRTDRAIARASLKTQAEKVAHLQTQQAIIVEQAQAQAMGVTAIATAKLRGAFQMLGTTIKSMGWTLLISLLIEGAMWLKNVMTASDKLNDSINEGKAQVNTATAELDYYFGALKRAKQGTEEFDTAKARLLEKYGEHINKLGGENRLLEDQIGLYRELKTEIENKTKAETADKLRGEAMKEHSENLVSNRKQMNDALDRLKGYKSTKGGLYEELLNAINKDRQGEEGSQNTAKVINKIMSKAHKEHEFGQGLVGELGIIEKALRKNNESIKKQNKAIEVIDEALAPSEVKKRDASKLNSDERHTEIDLYKAKIRRGENLTDADKSRLESLKKAEESWQNNVKTLSELDAVLKRLTGELSTLEIGSDEYKAVQKKIKNYEGMRDKAQGKYDREHRVSTARLTQEDRARERRKEILKAPLNLDKDVRTAYLRVKYSDRSLTEAEKEIKNWIKTNLKGKKLTELNLIPKLKGDELIKGKENPFDKATKGAKAYKEAMGEVTGMFRLLGRGASESTKQVMDFAGVMAQESANIVEQIAVTIPALKAEALAKGIASASGLPFPASLPAILSITASIVSMFASLPKFENGGIVGGSSFFGDNVIARVNSGELILNKSQQQNLASHLGGGGVSTEVNINVDKIRGADLYLAMSNYMKKTNKKL